MARIYGLLALLLTIIGSALGIKRYVEQNVRRKDELARREKASEQREDMDDAEIDDILDADKFIARRLRELKRTNKRK